ncbi:MAG TPA: pilus assembly protein TadG-related protein [Actinomycetes bacterium]|nr:pilus assembly protein TadG-related protein [Actinomycetes bacterium]
MRQVPRVRASPDEGTVLLLILGLVVIAGLLVAVVIDVTVLFLGRQSLNSAADGAVLAGAQAVDRAALYRNGLPAHGPLRLDEGAAREAVENYLVDAGIQAEYDDLNIGIVVTATTVRVELSATVTLPIVNVVTPGSRNGVHVDAVSTAQSAVIN